MHAFALVLSYAAMMALAIAINLLPVFLTVLARDFDGLTNEQLGRIGAVNFAGLVAAITITGPLVDRLPRHGAKAFAIGGNVLIAVGLAMLGLAPSYAMVLAASFVMGLGAGALDMVLSPIVAALEPHRRTVAMNLLHSFYCTGAVVTILAGSVALAWGIGWRACAFGLIALPLLVGLSFVPARIPALVAAGADRTRLRWLLRHGWFWMAMAAIFMGGATELGMAYWLPAYAEKSLGFNEWTAGMAFMSFNLAMAAGRLLIGLLGARVSAYVLLFWCCGTSAVLFLGASFLPWAAGALACCVLAGLAGSALWPSVLAVAADRYPHGGASMFGVLAALGNFGGIVMPWLVGIIADAVARGGGEGQWPPPLAWGLATAAACPLLMMGCLGVMVKWGKPSRR